MDVDQIKNWEPIKDKKLEVSEFAEDIAMLIAKDLSKGQADKQHISQPAGVLEEVPLMKHCTLFVTFVAVVEMTIFFL